MFEVAVHVATLLAILAFYRTRVVALVGRRPARRTRRLALRRQARAIGTLPAVALGAGGG